MSFEDRHGKRPPTERVIIEQLESEGYDVVVRGKPDIIAFRDGERLDVVVKSDRHKLEIHQRRAHAIYKKHGYRYELRRVNSKPEINSGQPSPFHSKPIQPQPTWAKPIQNHLPNSNLVHPSPIQSKPTPTKPVHSTPEPPRPLQAGPRPLRRR